MRRALLVASIILCGLVRPSAAQSPPADLPEANPARPTVSNPATLTPVGYLQFENGLLAGWRSLEFSSRAAFEQTMKLTLHPRLQAVLESEPIVGARGTSSPSVSAGGVSAGVQGVLLPGHGAKPTVALAYYGSIYSGPAPDIDIGSFKQSVVLLVSTDIAGFHVDVNGVFNEQTQGTVRRAQYGQTLSVSHPLARGLGIGGEVWHFTQPFLRSNTTGMLWTVTYAPRKNLVLDTGFNYGFNATSTRWEYFAGFTYLLPRRLWQGRGSRRP